MTTSLLLLLLAAEGAPAATPLEDAATRLSGAVGIGTFGSLDSAPVFAGLDATSRLTGQPLVPLLGLRWWTPLGGRVIRRVGVEVAGGFSVSAITRETAPNGMPTQQRLPTLRSLGAHVAIPIVLVSTPNFLGHLAPEARYLAIDQVSPMPTPPLIDTMPGAQERVPGSGTTEVSLRAAAEVFFGFIRVPNLSLELSLRLGLRVASSWSNDTMGNGVFLTTYSFLSPAPADLLRFITSTFALKYYL